MRTHVTVIPSDRVIIVDGQILHFDFDAPFNLHALQWHDGKGEIEFTDSTNQQFTEKEYDENVEPYVEAWEKEKARLDAEANKPPVPPTLEKARAAKLAEVMGAYQAAFAPIEAVYPAAEREGWAIQEAEARILMADPAADPAEFAPVLSALVQLRARGETPAELAAKVLQNAGQWRMVYAYLTGQQQRMYGEVSGLASVEEVLAYPVAYHLPEGL